MFVAVFAPSYAVTDLRGYDKMAALAAIAAIKEVVNAAAGPAGGRGRRGRPRAGVGGGGQNSTL